MARFDAVAARRVRAALRAGFDRSTEHPRLGRVVPELEVPAIRERALGSCRVMYVLPEDEVLVVAVVDGRQVAGIDDPSPGRG